MKQIEFLNTLQKTLEKNHVADLEDILAEYRQHFAFKLADGYTEEEIAAKLGDPALLAAQFEETAPSKRPGAGRIPTAIGLGIADLFAGMFFLLLCGWGLVLGAMSLGCGGVAICLLTDTNVGGILPPIPYWCGAVLAVSIGALAVLAAVGCVYFFAFLRQMLRSFCRFQRNAIALASGRTILPPLPIGPQFSPKGRRRLRTVALISLAVFAACFLLGLIVCMLSAGAFEFWHAWGWFGYAGG